MLSPAPVEDIEISGKGSLVFRIEWRRGIDTPGYWRSARVTANTPDSAVRKLRSQLTRRQYASGYEIGDLDQVS